LIELIGKVGGEAHAVLRYGVGLEYTIRHA
jgi:hypothetical protein